MTKKQAEAEMKYRLAVLLLNDLLEKGKVKIPGFLKISYFSNSRIIKKRIVLNRVIFSTLEVKSCNIY